MRIRALVVRGAACLILISVAVPVAAQEGSKTPKKLPGEAPTSTAKPQVGTEYGGRILPGDTAPDFELDDPTGKPVKLSSHRGDWLILTFSDRAETMPELSEIEHDMRLIGARILGVCREKVQTIRRTVRRDSVTFTVLADPTGQVAGVYGFFDNRSTQTLPGFLVIDRRGIVKLAVLGQRIPAEEIARIVRFTITGA